MLKTETFELIFNPCEFADQVIKLDKNVLCCRDFFFTLVGNFLWW